LRAESISSQGKKVEGGPGCREDQVISVSESGVDPASRIEMLLLIPLKIAKQRLKLWQQKQLEVV
jgi:hypothetical protein